MNKQVDFPNIRNITISGRIGSGATTLAVKLSKELGWEMLEGGQIMRRINKEVGADVVETNSFGSASVVLDEYQIGDKAYELNFQAAKMAKEVARDFSTAALCSCSRARGAR